MRVLFLHDVFPGQYRHLALALARNPANRVVFLARTGEGALAGIERRTIRPARLPHSTTHHYLVPLESAVLAGQAAYRACESLRLEGFVPDVVCAHSGFGPGLYVKEIFPHAPMLGYFEWFFRGPGREAEYLTGEPLSADAACRARTRNAAILMDLAACDRAVTPTRFQHAQFPPAFAERIDVLHDGVDTEFFHPQPGARLRLPGLSIPDGAPLVTYATRGMEAYRGFGHFMAAAAMLLNSRPELHVAVAGNDEVAYSAKLPSGRSYREQALIDHPELDSRRVHFVGRLAYRDYRALLQASSVHVYLTVPFVLSWSLLEAMATGCLIVGADTAPVAEVMCDEDNGLLVDFRDPMALADRIALALDEGRALQHLRRRARESIEDRYALRRLLPRQLAMVTDLARISHRSSAPSLVP